MNFKKFLKFFNFLQTARGLFRFAGSLKFEFQNISAKPCSLARFFVLGEKNFDFFHFLKSYFNFSNCSGLVLGMCLRLIRLASNNVFFSEESEYSTDF